MWTWLRRWRRRARWIERGYVSARWLEQYQRATGEMFERPPE